MSILVKIRKIHNKIIIKLKVYCPFLTLNLTKKVRQFKIITLSQVNNNNKIVLLL